MRVSCYHLWMIPLFISIVGLKAQTVNDYFKYEALIRNSDGELLIEESIGVEFTIYQNSPDGDVVFRESHSPITNANGAISLLIGDGSEVEGDWEEIPWSDGLFYIGVGFDLTGGTDFQTFFISQFHSVPYALLAKNASNVLNAPFQNSSALSLGMYYQGGIIVHLSSDENGVQHGLIMSANDLGEAAFGLLDQDFPDLSVWDGIANTQFWLAQGAPEDGPVVICDNYEIDGFDNWYLPSTDEFCFVKMNWSEIKNGISTIEGVSYPDGRYWTSTMYNSEVELDYMRQTLFLENSGISGSSDCYFLGLRSNPVKIRAFRRF